MLDAKARSIALLRRWLTAEQREDFDKTGTFIAVGDFTKAKYRIGQKSFFNIIDLSDNSEICFEPDCSYSAPIGDKMLAQKLAIEGNEKLVLEIANRMANGRLLTIINALADGDGVL